MPKESVVFVVKIPALAVTVILALAAAINLWLIVMAEEYASNGLTIRNICGAAFLLLVVFLVCLFVASWEKRDE